MAEWRFGHGWSNEELKGRLEGIRSAHLNFPITGPTGPAGEGWNRYYSEAVIGQESPGAPTPDGPFERAWNAIQNYQFSDPGIVTGHFDPRDPLLGRTMLLEIKALGLHYLCGARVGAVRERVKAGVHVRGIRFDTLEGHVEEGSEWFLLTKKEKTGEVWFRIHASWRPGQFPNWWSRVGFHLVARRYQLAWHRLAYLRLRQLLGAASIALSPVPEGATLLHSGGDVSDSDLWILNQPSATERVLALGKRPGPANSKGSPHVPHSIDAFSQREKIVECGGTRGAHRNAKLCRNSSDYEQK